MNDNFLSIKEAAEMLKCSSRTVQRHIKDGDISVVHFGRRVLIVKSALDNFLNKTNENILPSQIPLDNLSELK